MTSTKNRLGIGLFLLLVGFLPNNSIKACFDRPPYPVFVNVLHPDYPFQPFAGGTLGIVHPTYARSYLVVAYHYMDGGSFTPAQQVRLCLLWQDRLTRTFDSETRKWLDKWAQERNRISNPPVPDEIKRYLKKDDIWIYEGIYADAFKVALVTLHERQRLYGIAHPSFRAWLQAQDMVFSGKEIPVPLPPSASELERADRAYQIAAAQFYSGNWEESERLFGAIAKDKSSPWRTIAPYLVARAAVRVATFTTEQRPHPDLAALATCDDLLKTILENPDLASTHPAATRLRRHILIVRDPDRALSELDAALRSGAVSDLYQDLWDYTALLDRRCWTRNWDTLHQIRPADKEFAQTTQTRAAGELSDWLLTFQSNGGAAWQHALEMWKVHGTTPWLVAAISKVAPAAPDAAGLLQACSRVKSDSPAFLTVQYHRARLLLGLGKTQEARALLNGLLALPSRELPPSSRNQLLSARLCTATTFAEFLADLPRRPADICVGYSDEELPLATADYRCPTPPDSDVLLDEDGAKLLNEAVPLRLLAEAARSPLLPVSVRKKIAIAAWARAVLLERDREALDVSKELSERYPHLSEEFNEFVCAEAGESRQNAALFLLSRNPGITPRVICGVGRWNPIWRLNLWGANWWCTGAEPSAGAEGNVQTHFMFDPEDEWSRERLPILMAPPFLTGNVRDEAQNEMRLIADLGVGSTYIAKRVLDWAKARPKDPRIPEALHHACEALNYGECRNYESSEDLYLTIRRLLYNKYRDTQWNRTTPWR
jgi:hypothetical protein